MSGWQAPGTWGPHHLPSVSYMTRTVSLEGRINIYIAPQGNGTLVTVNSRYIFSVNIDEEAINCAPADNMIGRAHHNKNFKCSFDTNKAGALCNCYLCL